MGFKFVRAGLPTAREMRTGPPAPPPPILRGWRGQMRGHAHIWNWRLRGQASLRRTIASRLGFPDAAWLFVVGTNNSGTSLLVELLKSHPSVRSLPSEGQLLTDALPWPRGLGVPRLWGTRLDLFHWTQDHADDRRALKVMYDWSLFYPRGKGYLLEKSPPNTVRTRWLEHHFQPCRFVATARDPYAVCEGVMRREGFTIEQAAEHWAAATGCLLEDLTHLQKVHFVTYENFCADPAGQIAALSQFLELDPPLDPSQAEREFHVHSADRKSRPIENLNARSIARLTPEQRATITRICGTVMERAGYQAIA
jgi:hypothetical protein